MNIAIVGAGMSGISTALELARDGHQVTVYEQLNATAEDASFAPGGWLLPATTQALAAPGAGMPLKQLQRDTDVLQANSLIGSSTWRWMRQWKRHEKSALKQGESAFASALHTLSQYSANLRESESDPANNTAERQHGALVLLRNPEEAHFWSERLPQLQAQGIACKILNPEKAQILEPGLAQDIAWLNALHFPQGETINPRLWAHQLRLQAQNLGVTFQTGVPVEHISTQPIGLHIAGRLHPFDHVVLCTGAHTPLLAALGLALPLIQVWGYSVTAPVRDPLHAPRAALMDWAQQATISRMGQRVRITAGLEIGSHADAAHRHATLERMYHLLNDWFPGGAHLSSPQVQVWRGARGHLPDGLPATGPSPHPGIWLNMAHGSHGTCLASGCARALADMLKQQATAIDMQAFSPLRF